MSSREDHRYDVERTEAQWRELLTPAEFQVLRQGGTEPPHVGRYTNTTQSGSYTCRGCDAVLFSSDTKFASHCGWPSFYAPASQQAVEYREDDSLFMRRIEVLCARCGSHLGHVFHGEGYPTPTDERYCINSVCLRLDSDDEQGPPPA